MGPIPTFHRAGIWPMPLTWGLPGRISRRRSRLRRRSGCSRLARVQVRLRPGACRGPPGGRAGFRFVHRARLRALAVYLVVFQHVPVERCRQLIADVTGAVVSDGFVHSCLAKAASLAAEVVRLIRTLITAAAVAGFDETTLRSGQAGEKKYVHGAFTGEYSAFWLGTRSLDSMAGAGILPDFAGIVVSDRYQNYFHPRWEHIAGNQACADHILRDYQDCARLPDASGRAGAAGAARLIMPGTPPRAGPGRIPGVREPLEHEFRHAVSRAWPACPRPRPKNSTKRRGRHPDLVDMPVIVRHQDRGALRLDHRHDQALCRRRAVI